MRISTAFQRRISAQSAERYPSIPTFHMLAEDKQIYNVIKKFFNGAGFSFWKFCPIKDYLSILFSLTACKLIMEIIWFCIFSTVSILTLPILFLIISKSTSGNSLSHKLFVSGDAPIKAITRESMSNCFKVSFNSFSGMKDICSKSFIRLDGMSGSNKLFIVMPYNLERFSRASKSDRKSVV